MDWRRPLGRILPAGLLLLAAAVNLTALALLSGREQQTPRFSTMEAYYTAQYGEIRTGGMSDYAQYDYERLYSRAHTVAIVTPTEALSAENTYGISPDGDRYYNLHAVRTFQVEAFFKNERGYGETMEIAEKCGRLADGSIIAEENCYPMEMGHFYLVFLTGSGYGYPLYISANNGYFDLNLLSLNAYQTVLIHALYDLALLDGDASASLTPLMEGFSAAKILCSTADLEPGASDSPNWKAISLDTEYTEDGYALMLYYDDDTGGDNPLSIWGYIYGP